MKSSNFLKAAVFGLSVFSWVGVSGCGDDESSTTTKDQFSLRVAHLSPNAPAVDVLANGTIRAVTDLQFTKSTGYLKLDVGSYTFDVVPKGGAASASVLKISNPSLLKDKSYTVAAINKLASIEALLLEDNASAVASGKIRVRAIHAAPGVGAVDIWNIPFSGSPSKLYENVPFKGVGNYLELPAGAYTLGIDANRDGTADLVFELPSLAAGTIANVFAVQDSADKVFLAAQLGDGTIAAIQQKVSAPPAQVRVFHLSPDAPAVDVYADGNKAITSLAFGSSTEYLSLAAGSHDFAVVPAGGSLSQAVIKVDGLVLKSDSRYSVVAYNNLSSIAALALEDDSTNLMDGKIRVRPVHVAVGVGTVDVWSIPESGNPAKIVSQLDFGKAGSALDLPSGVGYNLALDVDKDGRAEVFFQVPALPAGTVANLFAVADKSNKLSLRAQLQNSTVALLDPVVSKIRVLHLSSDAPAVDVFVNSTLRAVKNLVFLKGTDYLELVPNLYDFDISPAGGSSSQSVLAIDGLKLGPTNFYTAVAFNRLSKIQALALQDDYSNLASGKIRVRAIHAAPDVGTVDIWNIPKTGSPSKIYSAVKFGDIGQYLELPFGSYTLGFDVNADANPDVVFDTGALPSGTVANVFAVSSAADGVFLVAQLQDGQTVKILHR